ncbi:zinc finger protein 501-like isoform X1 [Pleurodeles waltl]|uniref:zinc finger protein 501-like isoform X1 n=1 Tax=Pleurodeles waltl TaxID=8319 RepID=UPI0037097DA8
MLRNDSCSKLIQKKENTLQNPDRGNNSTKKMGSKCKRDPGGQKSTRFKKGFRKVMHSSLQQGIAKMSYSNNAEQNVKLVKYKQNPQPKMTDYTCPTCQKQFSVKGYLTRHLRIHSCVHQHQCTECNKCFSRKKNLVIHLRTHSGERPFECTECEKGFNEKKSLIIHLRRHSGERPFQCTKCEKGFTTRGGLVVHLRTHSGERPYQCTECHKSFIQKGHLRKHQKIHSGERHFLCPKCGISFVQETQLISHQKVHSSKEEKSTRHKEENNILSDFHEPKATLTAERQNQCNECRKNLRELNNHIRFHRTYKGEHLCKCTECEKIFAENTHHIMQQRMHSGERPGKRHTVVARLLEVSVPNEYFILHHD